MGAPSPSPSQLSPEAQPSPVAPALGRAMGLLCSCPWTTASIGVALGIAPSVLGASSLESLSALSYLCAGACLAAAGVGFSLQRLPQTPLRTGTTAPAPHKASGIHRVDEVVDGLLGEMAKLEESRLSAEAASREVIDRQKVLTDNIAAAVVLRDAANALAYCSPYTEVLTGYSRKEIFERSKDFFLEVVHPDDRERYERALKIGAMGEAFQIRHRLLHKTGIEMWVETRTVPILGDEGEVTQSLSVMLDVTGAVRYQKQVEEKNRDLHDFAYMVSHDLKGPIATIKGMLGIFEEDLRTTLTSEGEETLRHIRGATQKLEQLVASVLEYSKISSLDERSEPVELATVLQELLQHLSPQLSPVGATITIAPSPPTVIGEHVWLYQVFSNLLGNAIKYREPSRPLLVEITFLPQASGREIVVKVSDNGLGIPKDKQPQLFRPFQRAHGNTIEGTGIGLASVKRVLEKCGGSVRLESTEGIGSSFFVTLRTAR